MFYSVCYGQIINTMALKIFSLELPRPDGGFDEKTDKKNEDRLVVFTDRVNAFLENNKTYKKTDFLQSSAGSHFGSKTTITVVLESY